MNRRNFISMLGLSALVAKVLPSLAKPDCDIKGLGYKLYGVDMAYCGSDKTGIYFVSHDGIRDLTYIHREFQWTRIPITKNQNKHE